MQDPVTPQPSRRWSGRARLGFVAVAATLLLGLLAACGSDSAGSGAAGSTTVAKGENADSGSGGTKTGDAPSCAVVAESNALVPGLASTEGAPDGSQVGLDPGTMVKDAETIAGGIKAAQSGPLSLLGWAFSTLTASSTPSDPDKQELDAISNHLDQISAQLTDIEAQLAAITNLIKDTTYINAVKSLTDDHIAPILSMWQQYCDVVSSKDTNKATIDKLTDSILDPATGVRAHTTAIVTAMKGSSLTGNVPLAGMFSEFVKDQQKIDEFDDQDVYKDSLDPFTDYFANLTVMGLMLMTEAWHEQNNPTEAQATLNDFWADTRAVYQAGGYPISDDTVITQNTTGNVWTRTAACPKATFPSSEALQHLGDPDAVQAALAWGAAALQDNKPNPPDLRYDFQPGDPVCSLSTQLFPDEADMAARGTSLVKQWGLPSAHVWSGSGDPNQAWRLALPADVDALVKNKGSKTAEEFLDPAGFVIPAKGLGASPFILEFPFDSFDAGSGPRSDGVTFQAYHVVANAGCRLGAADYPGFYTACGTDWLDQRWPASPPPPGS